MTTPRCQPNEASSVVESNHGPSCDSGLTVAVSNKEKPSFSSTVDKRERKGLLPLFFERASSKLWEPTFDSDILEREFKRFSVNVDRHRFQTGVLFIAFACTVLSIFFGVTASRRKKSTELIAGTSCGAVLAVIFFIITKFANLYRKPKEAFLLSLVFSGLYAIGDIVSYFIVDEHDFPHVARFTVATCIILLIYTMMPALPMYVCLVLAISYSVTHETVAALKTNYSRTGLTIFCYSLLHVCIHLMGLAIFFMAQVRQRSTFWRVGQSVVAKRDLEIEKQVKDRMIRSVMPKTVADWLISDGLKKFRVASSEPKLPFRPYNMFRMENVSILFADIVGFTKMSSNKSAETLVNLLNSLFGKFDELTEINNCEKISTLGDCYYCVAGCPEKTPHHATCCVEMGLDIVAEIKRFREEKDEDVDMRVGIHTGSVLCGIVGDRRRRFDVWSNDVTLANKMEAAGKPGRVHITETTLKFLNDEYEVEEGDTVSLSKDNEQSKTYFIVKRNNELACNKPWEIDRKRRDSNSSLKQAIKGGMSASSKSLSNGNSASLISLTKSTELEQASPVNVLVIVTDESNNTTVQTTGLELAEDDSIELGYLAQTQSPPSPRPQSRLAQQLMKTPLPFQRLNEQLNLNRGLALNEALMRDTLRASNDQQLVKLMHEKKIQKEYFFNPPLSSLTLQFIDRGLEKKYRSEGFKGFKLNPKVTTFASPKVHFFFDVLTSTVMLFIVLLASHLLFAPASVPLIVVTPICINIIVLVLLFQCCRFAPHRCSWARQSRGEAKENSETTSQMDIFGSETHHPPPPAYNGYLHKTNTVNNKKRQTLRALCLSPWFNSHICGATLMCLPMTLVFSGFETCVSEGWSIVELSHFSSLMTVALLHFCSFTQLSSFMKTALAFVWSAAFVLVLALLPKGLCKESKNTKLETTNIYDVIITVCLQVLLVVVMNRIHEEGVRVNFYGDKEAAEQKNKSLEQKQVADWLIQDMFPRHVSEQLKYTSHCSKNYDNIGVLFATVVNFDEFYEENFEGGIECIRILHELVADFDKEIVKFEEVEKIKSVNGTTYMAASGLNSTPVVKALDSALNTCKFHHLRDLVNFALAMQNAMNEFNENMLGFRFHLRCGFNAGPATAGVIGTMKPQYDIWGDTVNLASRMDSTGVSDRIQVSEATMLMLKEFYTFEERGSIMVKGKGNVTTYLLVGRVGESNL